MNAYQHIKLKYGLTNSDQIINVHKQMEKNDEYDDLWINSHETFFENTGKYRQYQPYRASGALVMRFNNNQHSTLRAEVTALPAGMQTLIS